MRGRGATTWAALAILLAAALLAACGRVGARDGQYDPHVWFDVGLSAETVDTVRDALIELDPGHAAIYRAKAKTYRAELEALDEYVRRQAAHAGRASRARHGPDSHLLGGR